MGDALVPEDVHEVTCFSLLKALSVQQSDSMALVVIKKQLILPVIGIMGVTGCCLLFR